MTSRISRCICATVTPISTARILRAQIRKLRLRICDSCNNRFAQIKRTVCRRIKAKVVKKRFYCFHASTSFQWPRADTSARSSRKESPTRRAGGGVRGLRPLLPGCAPARFGPCRAACGLWWPSGGGSISPNSPPPLALAGGRGGAWLSALRAPLALASAAAGTKENHNPTLIRSACVCPL